MYEGKWERVIYTNDIDTFTSWTPLRIAACQEEFHPQSGSNSSIYLVVTGANPRYYEDYACICSSFLLSDG